MKKLSIVCIILLSLICAGLVSAGEYKGRAVKIKMASEDIEGDFMTTWGQKIF